jgi:hypothetical protein
VLPPLLPSVVPPSCLATRSALSEARIPPGPRLLILHHLDTYRNPSSILKPALPLPQPPMQQAAAAGR